MKNYEYKYVKVPIVGAKKGILFKSRRGDTFEACKEVIDRETANGWRLKQIVVPINEKTGVYGAYCYQVVFEREIERKP